MGVENMHMHPNQQESSPALLMKTTTTTTAPTTTAPTTTQVAAPSEMSRSTRTWTFCKYQSSYLDNIGQKYNIPGTPDEVASIVMER
jgi:hypothetical protein